MSWRTASIDATAIISVAASPARKGVSRSEPQTLRRATTGDADCFGGITPPGTPSSADTIRVAPAIIPRASATSAAHSAQSRDVLFDEHLLIGWQRAVEPGMDRSFVKMLHVTLEQRSRCSLGAIHRLQ